MPTGTPFNPAGIAKPSVGQALFNLGFTTTRWIPQDGTVNDLKEGRFDPTSNSPIQRYGNPKGLGAKGWPPDQYTGGHSTGQNPHAIKLAPIVLGASADPQQDATDLNFVKGATQRVLQLARDQGLLAPVFVPPSEKPVPEPMPTPTPIPPVEKPKDPEPPLPSDYEQRLRDLEELIIVHGQYLSDHRKGLEAGKARLERAEKSIVDLAHTVSVVDGRLALLEGATNAPTPTPIPLPPVPLPPTPTPPVAGKETFFAPDFVVGIGGADGPVASFTDGATVMRCHWKPKEKRYRAASLEMTVDIPNHHFTGQQGEKENLFWLAIGNNFSLIGYGLLTEKNLICVEGLGMRHGDKERVSGKGLAPGKYHLSYTWKQGGSWWLQMEGISGTIGGSTVGGSATGQLDFSGNRPLLLDCGFPGAPGSVEIPTPGWKFSDIVVSLEA
jgi:hypothetical protein